MLISIKKIPILTPLILFTCFEIIFFWPNIFVLIVLVIVLLIVSLISLLILMKEKIKKYWPIFIQIIFLILSGFLFSLLLSPFLFYQIFSIIMTILYWFILKTLFYLFYQPRLYFPYSLENISIWIIFLTIFFLATELSALSFFYLSFWLTILPFFVFTFLSYFLSFQVNKIDSKQKIEIIIFSLILTEFYFVLNFLPISFYLLGLILVGLNIIIFKLWLSAKKLILPTVMKS